METGHTGMTYQIGGSLSPWNCVWLWKRHPLGPRFWTLTGYATNGWANDRASDSQYGLAFAKSYGCAAKSYCAAHSCSPQEKPPCRWRLASFYPWYSLISVSISIDTLKKEVPRSRVSSDRLWQPVQNTSRKLAMWLCGCGEWSYFMKQLENCFSEVVQHKWDRFLIGISASNISNQIYWWPNTTGSIDLFTGSTKIIARNR